VTDGRIYLDTAFVQALLNRRDQYHPLALALLPRVRSADEVWTTEAVLVEIGNAMSGTDRAAAASFISQCYQTANMRVVSVDSTLLFRALDLYRSHADKLWGLTDCISFIVMREQGLTEAATADSHFVQAGFHALLRDSSA
jgi:predicted nucleic acid-binding protein